MLSLLSAALLLCQDKTGSELVTPKLIADQTVVTPGSTFNVGVQLTMEPGWHTYWINPGDSGLATQMSWRLPAGFAKPKSVLWPTPHRIEAGGLVSYGYEGTATPIVSFRMPEDAKPGQKFTLTVDLDWFVCKETCYTGAGSASLTVTAGDRSSVPAFTSRLSKAFFETPASMTGTRFEARATEDHIILDVHLPVPYELVPAGLYFFAEEVDLVEASAMQTVEKTDFGLRMFLVRSQYAVDNPAVLKGILSAPKHMNWLNLNNQHSIVVNAQLKPTD